LTNNLKISLFFFGTPPFSGPCVQFLCPVSNLPPPFFGVAEIIKFPLNLAVPQVTSLVDSTKSHFFLLRFSVRSFTPFSNRTFQELWVLLMEPPLSVQFDLFLCVSISHTTALLSLTFSSAASDVVYRPPTFTVYLLFLFLSSRLALPPHRVGRMLVFGRYLFATYVNFFPAPSFTVSPSPFT